MIGLTGPNGTGKTTLANAFAKERGIPCVETSASAVFKRMGLDPKADYPFEMRLAIQEMLLGVFCQQYKTAAAKSSLFVTDRTPIDLASYLLADVQRETVFGNDNANQATIRYVDSCLAAATHYFSVIVLVQPGIQLAEREGKAPQCPSYMAHLNAVQLGLMCDERFHGKAESLPRAATDLTERVRLLTLAASGAIPTPPAVAERVLH